MIHCCSVASSRQLFCSPLFSRIRHWRSIVVGDWSLPAPPIGASSNIESGRGGLGLGVRGRPVSRGASRPVTDGEAVPTLVVARLRILNMCPQLVHLTVTPPGFRRASSSSYSV